MRRLLEISIVLVALFAVASLSSAEAAQPQKRLALVIGNAAYKAKALATPVNDAALIAQTLLAAGFDVTGARDLGEDSLRQTFRDFIDSAAKAGPDAVVTVYFSGYGLQSEGENYLIPIDAEVSEASAVPLRTVRLSEQTRALAALHLKAAFVILDAARASPFILSGQRPASGLAWVEPEPNMLIAFNAAPGTVSPDAGNGYGPYAKALAEMIREGGLSPANLFDRVRLRVNEMTKGGQVPWDASRIEAQFKFFERTPDAPPRNDLPERTARMRSQPMRSLGAHDAYMVALLRDTFDAYADFLADYWRDPMTKRVRALLAARREAITWRRTCQANLPDAYWSYLARFPRGPHVADAHRLLAHLGASTAPPSKFAMVDYDVPPPLPDELEYIERTVLVFDDPAFAFEPPQPPPVYFLEPSPPEFLSLAPPAAPSGAHILPAPVFAPLPVYVRLPADVVPPSHPVMVNTSLQAAPSPIPSSNANDLAGSTRLPPSVAARTMLIDSRPQPMPITNEAVREEARVSPHSSVGVAPLVPSWATLDPAEREQVKAPSDRPVRVLSAIPSWATDSTTSARSGAEPPLLTNELPIPVPTTLSPSSTAILPRSGRTAILSAQSTGSIPVPIPRSVALANPRSATPLRTPRVPILSTQTTDSSPPPIFRATTVAPQPTRSRPKSTTNAVSNANPASTSSRIRADQAKQPNAPLNGLAPSTHLVRAPKATPEAQPKP